MGLLDLPRRSLTNGADPDECSVCRRHELRKAADKTLKRTNSWIEQLKTTSAPSTETTVNNLLVSSKSGCPGCRLLIAVVEVLQRDPGVSSYAGPHNVVVKPVHDGTVLEVWALFMNDKRDVENSEWASATMYFSGDTQDKLPFGRAYLRPPLHDIPSVSTWAGGDVAFETISAWLAECDDKHWSCTSPFPGFHPKRLLDVTPGLPGDDDSILLIEAPTDFQDKYITLSHCWDTADDTITSPIAYEDYAHNIPVSTLPLTFSDAVTITRRLGVKYLWIGELCMLQGDAREWAEHSSQARNIYANGYLTIAASSAKDVHSGIFGLPRITSLKVASPHRKMDGTSELAARIHWKISRENELDKLIRAHRTLDGWKAQGHEGLPSGKGAWIFSERPFSRRVLHYTAGEIIFECRRGIQCECDRSVRQPPTQLFERSKNSRKGTMKRQNTKTEKNTPQSRFPQYKEWIDGLEHYSSLSMRVPTDVLPALSSLANGYADYCKGRAQDAGAYYAGLWENHLPASLLWHGSGSQICDQYRGPSWSWASVQGRIKHLRDFEESTPQDSDSRLVIRSIKCTQAGSDLFGQVLSGSLIIAGYLFRYDADETLLEHCPKCSKELAKPSRVSLCQYPDNGMAALRAESQDSVNLKDDGKKSESAEEKIPDCNLLYLLVQHGRSVSRGLMLRKVKDGKFEKVGCFTIDWTATSWQCSLPCSNLAHSPYKPVLKGGYVDQVVIV